MRLGRHLLVTAIAVAASLGCNGAIGGAAKSSSTAPGSTAAPPAPTGSNTFALASATFSSPGMKAQASQGDQITVQFAQNVTLTGTLDPNVEFVLPVKGNTFGTGATMAAAAMKNQVTITLGANPSLRISGVFAVANVGSGDSSGIDMPKTPTGHIGTLAGLKPGSGPVDIGGAYQEQWSPGAAMAMPRGLHQATLMNDGRILVTGGLAVNVASLVFANMSEVYDPVANAFTYTNKLGGPQGDMLVATTFAGAATTIAVGRTEHTSTLLADGRVLVAGGFGYEALDPAVTATPTALQADLVTAHIFDPKTNTFSQTAGKLGTARSHHSAVVLSNGKVLFEGGLNNTTPAAINSAEIFDPATGTFTGVAATLSAARFDGVAAYDQAAKQVIYAGGVGVTVANATPALTLPGGADVFDEATSKFVGPANPPPQSLRWQAATTDAAGEVYIAGGNGVALVSSLVAVYSNRSFAALTSASLATARARAKAVTLGGTIVLVAAGSSLSGQPGHELAACEVLNTDTRLLQKAPSLATPRNSFTLTAANGRAFAIGGFHGDNGMSAASLGGVPVAMAEIYSRP